MELYGRQSFTLAGAWQRRVPVYSRCDVTPAQGIRRYQLI
jgi:hypothetical protein